MSGLQEFWGFPRPDGSVGVRNLVAVISAADAVNPVARRIALPGEWHRSHLHCLWSRHEGRGWKTTCPDPRRTGKKSECRRNTGSGPGTKVGTGSRQPGCRDRQARGVDSSRNDRRHPQCDQRGRSDCFANGHHCQPNLAGASLPLGSHRGRRVRRVLMAPPASPPIRLRVRSPIGW